MSKWRQKGVRASDIDLEAVAQECRSLIDTGPSEAAVQEFIESHCYLLVQPRNDKSHTAVVSKPRLADEFVPDFIMLGGCNRYWVTLVEIEKPSDKMFTGAGDYSAALMHALRQVSDWRAWIRANVSIFQSYFGRPLWIRYEIIIGRRDGAKDSWHKLDAFDKDITISSFDSLVPGPRSAFHTGYNGRIQREVVTFPEFKEIYNIRTGAAFEVDPVFLAGLWDNQP